MLLATANQLRLTENYDWVIITLLCCAGIYLFLMNIVLRDASLKGFFMGEYAGSSNNFFSNLIITTVFCFTATVLFSQYIPIVPKNVSKIGLFGVVINKFSFTLFVLIVFYLLKFVLGYIFYMSTGNGKKWGVFGFWSTRFYFGLSFILMALCIMHYYFPIDKLRIFPVYVGILVLAFGFKIVYYLFHRDSVLPSEWYYKFLYICTLQIVPLIALWNILFL